MPNTIRLGHRNEELYVFIDDQTLLPCAPSVTGGLVNVANWVYDFNALAWVAQSAVSGLSATQGIALGVAQSDQFNSIITELKTITYFIKEGLNVPDNPQAVRDDRDQQP